MPFLRHAATSVIQISSTKQAYKIHLNGLRAFQHAIKPALIYLCRDRHILTTTKRTAAAMVITPTHNPAEIMMEI